MQPQKTIGASKILIVEDEPLTAMLVAEAVRGEGHEVVGPYECPAKACAAVERGGVIAALLDVSLGGDRTSATVAEMLEAAGVPFAFVTGYGAETAAVVRAHPNALVIPKPADEETIRLLLSELTGDARARDAS